MFNSYSRFMKAFLLNLIVKAGDFIAEQAKLGFEIQEKSGKNNLVTAVDLAAEKMIKEAIAHQYPDHGFLGEEYGSHNEAATHLWIIDPIDGTVNFAHGIPLYCVSIALAVNQELVLGAIYNPESKELFYAEKGKGAFLNHKKICVSQQSDFEKAFLVTGFPYHFPEGIDVANTFIEVVHQGLPVRRLGSAALDLAFVACGRFDGFWEYLLNPWDIAAGYLLVQEAGGKVSNFSNEIGHFSHKETLATNGKIHESLLALIQKHKIQ